MKVLELIDEILDEIEQSRKGLFTNKKTIDVDFVLEILEEIKEALPQDVLYAQEVLDKEKDIVVEAQEEATNIMDHADKQLNKMIEEHKVTQLAYEKANRIVDAAQKQSYELRVNANNYAVEVLEDVSSYLGEYIDIIRENQSNFINRKNKDQAEFE
ncbi:MAG: hypothetical protein ACOYJB_02885 [Christensenellaceae bacterium]|jgi:vacuolar-type H+-ATPase subunit H